MTPLQHNALGCAPLTVAVVESIYTLPVDHLPQRTLRSLCESHERLRAEVAGAEVMIADAEKEAAARQESLVNALVEVDRLKAELAVRRGEEGLHSPGEVNGR